MPRPHPHPAASAQAKASGAAGGFSTSAVPNPATTAAQSAPPSAAHFRATSPAGPSALTLARPEPWAGPSLFESAQPTPAAAPDVPAVRPGPTTGPASASSTAPLALRVFASGSQGNCTLLRAGSAHVLIDLGLSPRRTAALLAAESLTFDDLEAVLLTHLDHDHAHAGWCAQIGTDAPLPRHVEVFVPRTSLGRAQRMGFNAGRALPFRSPFRTRSGLRVDPLMNFHDALGSAAFRLTLETTSIGFATDLGRVTDELVAHLRHVDVLAIESNYCPALQAASPRPTFLKRRITGGRGHLSNAECREATSLIAPRTHTLLLHLSRQCNTPELAAAPHAGAPYGLTICNQHGPSPWVAAAK